MANRILAPKQPNIQPKPCPDEPLGFIENDRLLAILQALSLTNCDPRTLAVVAWATGLGEWWREAAREERAVYLLEERR